HLDLSPSRISRSFGERLIQMMPEVVRRGHVAGRCCNGSRSISLLLLVPLFPHRHLQRNNRRTYRTPRFPTAREPSGDSFLRPNPDRGCEGGAPIPQVTAAG